MRAFACYDELTRSFRDMYDAIDATNCSLRYLTPPRRCHITTMTFTATVSHAEPIRDAFIDQLQRDAHRDPYFTTIGPSAFSKSAVEFYAASMPSVKTKLFNKGALQLTGCKSHVEAMHTIVEVCRVLSASCGHEIEALTMSCALINMNVTVDATIRLSRFADAVRAKGWIAEQPERPPSCILKYPSRVPGKVVSGLVYKTGNFVICGAPVPRDVSDTYRYIMQVFDEAWDTVLEPRRPESHFRSRGHGTWWAFVHCGMPGLLHTHPPTTRARVDGCAYCARRGNYFHHHVCDYPQRHSDPEIHGEPMQTSPR